MFRLIRQHRLTGLSLAMMLVTAAGLPFAQEAWAQTGNPERHVALPDTETSKSGSFTAWLIDPTTRYAHGVLGDAIEAGGFVVERSGKRLVYRLPSDAVFEDRRVRLADLDGDGVPEAIVVKAYLQRGAAIAVYRILPDRIEPLAESAAIGTRNRWLNPVGVADFTGTGRQMIAAVITPHLTGSLRLYSLSGSTLTEVARLDGYTNHVIGSRDLDLARVVKVTPRGAPHIIIPTLDRNALAAISFHRAEPHVIRTWPIRTRIEGLRIDARVQARILTASGEQIIDLKER